MSYGKSKECFKLKAAEHMAKLAREYSADVQNSIAKTRVYREVQEVDLSQSNCTRTITAACDSVSAIYDYREGKTAVLNFASYKNPGGKFLDGSMAQEESLCHCSTLYPVLSYNNEYYDYNRSKLNKGLYTSAALYSEDIVFMSDGLVDVKCDVITCAAPNYSVIRRYGNATKQENTQCLKNRIEFVLSVAAANNVDTLILGAWGCGVFGQDPREVAELFQNALEKYNCFKKVVFAIPPGYNYNMFAAVFN